MLQINYEVKLNLLVIALELNYVALTCQLKPVKTLEAASFFLQWPIVTRCHTINDRQDKTNTDLSTQV